MKTTKQNLIPTAATVTLPAGEYFALIKLANDLIADCDQQLDDIKVDVKDDKVVINHSEIKPYAKVMTDRVAELLASNDTAMERLVESGAYKYSAGNSWLDNYSWSGTDLRENYPEFAKAWQAATIRVNNKAAKELEGGTDDESNT